MKSNNFQLIILVIFIALAVFGVLVFANVIKIGNTQKDTGPTGTVTLWGTERSTIMAPIIDEFNNKNEKITIRYVGKSKETFDQDLLEAIASGTGPDLFLLPDDLAYSYANKISVIPYTSFPELTFKNSFAPASEVFLTNKGILAFPLAIDPLVMYYNRSTLDSNDIIYPPMYWDDFVSLVPKLTKKDQSGQITSSAVALGQFANVAHAKNILTTLFMQTGNNIIDETGGTYFSTLGKIGERSSSLENILSFYINFADPLSPSYTWNKSLPNSDIAFSAGQVAFYFGFASEIDDLIKRNPNQDFAVAYLPGIKNAPFKRVSSKVTGVAISSFSKKYDLAFSVASLLSTGDFASKFATTVGTPPARRDLLIAKNDSNIYNPIFYGSALYAKSWLDPSPRETDTVFKQMIESVLSNSASVEQAVLQAHSTLSLLLVR